MLVKTTSPGGHDSSDGPIGAPGTGCGNGYLCGDHWPGDRYFDRVPAGDPL